MIKVIAGKKGSGKTKRLIDMTNETAATAEGVVVFLDDDNRYIFDVDRKVRFVNAGEYHVHTPDMFLGFLSGMLSQNYDITTVFVDSFSKLAKTDIQEAGRIFEVMEELSSKHDVDFICSVSEDIAVLPEAVAKYVI